MAEFTVSLSSDKANSSWGENTKLSFAENGAVIHLSNGDSSQGGKNERTIQQVARKLDGLNIPEVTLTGEWTKEQQWAFALSFTRARNPSTIKWADNDDKQWLEQNYAALLFTRQLVNDTPEDLSPCLLYTSPSP